MAKTKFMIIIEQDEDGNFIGTVPEVKSCYTEAKSLEELIPRVKEVLELCLEEQGVPEEKKELIGIQQIEINV